MDGPIAVLAGTPVDTRMGVEYLTDRGLPGLAFPVSDGPREQTAFQHAPAEEKQRRAREILEAAGSQGCRRAFVYCNSLSGAVDFPALAEETGLRIVTPLDVYRLLAPRYHRLAVIAANAQGLSGIEGVLLQANPQLDLLGACSLPVVLSVEASTEPRRLVEQHHLMDLAAWFAGCGAEALVLGCTHFPHFKDALAERTALPLVDPAEEMARSLARCLEEKGTARRGGPGRLTIYTTGDVEEYALRARQVGLERVERVVCYPPMEL